MFRGVLGNQKGSYTLEASLVIPVILVVLLGVVFFSIYIYEKLVLLDAAVYSARQTATVWDNSRKDPETGSLGGDFRTDGLYWRITDDHSDSDLVRQKTGSAIALTRTRLRGGIPGDSEPADISVAYSNSLVQRIVTVDISRKAAVPPVLLTGKPAAGRIGSMAAGHANSVIAEPVEFIRNWELAAGYINEARNFLANFAVEKAAAGDARTIIASSQSDVNGKKVYHYPGCRHIGNMKQENIIEFGSVDEANAGGYHICVDCAGTVIGHN